MVRVVYDVECLSVNLVGPSYPFGYVVERACAGGSSHGTLATEGCRGCDSGPYLVTMSLMCSTVTNYACVGELAGHVGIRIRFEDSLTGAVVTGHGDGHLCYAFLGMLVTAGGYSALTAGCALTDSAMSDSCGYLGVCAGDLAMSRGLVSLAEWTVVVVGSTGHESIRGTIWCAVPAEDRMLFGDLEVLRRLRLRLFTLVLIVVLVI